MVEVLILGIMSYISTNIDDMFLNTIFFSEAEDRSEHKWIYIGKYMGIGLLVLVSLIVASGLQLLPHRILSFLGIIPILLGIKEIISSTGNDKENDNPVRNQSKNRVLQVMAITVANGADNIGIYTPLFAGIEIWQIVTIMIIFLFMTAIWCYIGKKLSELPVLRHVIEWYKGVLVPVVYIALGMYILF